MAQKLDQPIRCLVVPADPGFMVIPSASVAEIVPLALDQSSADGSLLGTLAWRGINVPVYSMEGLSGHKVPAFGKRSKAFIFYPWKGSGKKNFFAIASIHDPRPRIISADDIKDSHEELPESEYVRSSFSYDGEIALIPDLAAISLQQSA